MRCSAARQRIQALERRARWAPRLSCATAWISSTITVSAARGSDGLLGLEQDVERLRRGDQHVRRPSRHRLALVRRGSPERTITRMSGT